MVVIRQALAADADKLPQIERSAVAIFRGAADLAWIQDGDVIPVARHQALIAQGTEWVGLDDAGEIAGFLSAERRGGDLHIWEVSVHHAQQGRGIGRALVEASKAWARDQDVAGISLTTFRAVPWNEPFYRSVGFRTLNDEELSPELARILAAEAGTGLPRDKRCAMRLDLL